jgi:hypothetical protein
MRQFDYNHFWYNRLEPQLHQATWAVTRKGFIRNAVQVDRFMSSLPCTSLVLCSI